MTTNIDGVLDGTSVARLRELIGDRDDAVVAIATTDGELLWGSTPGSAGLFGRALEEYAGQSQFDYVHPDDRERLRIKMAQATAGATVRYDVRAQTAGGSWVALGCVAWAIDTPDGRRIVSITVPKDVD